MESKVNQEPQRLVQTADRVIWIIGSNRLQNDLIALFLEREIGLSCLVSSSMSDFALLNKAENEGQAKLILWDCRSKDPQGLLNELSFCGVQGSSQDYIVLVNVKPGLGIEEKCVWKGIRGFFYEHDPRDRFLKGIVAVLNGELWLSREIVSKCILEGKGQDQSAQETRAILTPRQVEILALVAVGASNEEIADKLCISRHTVKTHLYKIFKKIDVPNRLQGALWAAKNLEYVIPKYYPLD
jgi:LuxR family transcriptional regulator of csgAB operon